MLRIKQQHDSLQSLLKLREDMVNMIVHDLRNSLACIVLGAEILRFPNLSAQKQQAKVEQILLAGQQLQSLIDSLLLLAKLESGKMVLNYTQVDLWALCMSALTGVRQSPQVGKPAHGAVSPTHWLPLERGEIRKSSPLPLERGATCGGRVSRHKQSGVRVRLG